jgi:hypothetical protein
VIPGLSGVVQTRRHVLPQRPAWYACACCPPNVARLLLSLGQYAWGEGEDTVYAHMFLGDAYLGGMTACSDFNRSAVALLAYDELVKAREALPGDASALEIVNQQIAACRAYFPSSEDIFFNGHSVGASYHVSCGWISGTTTIRAR